MGCESDKKKRKKAGMLRAVASVLGEGRNAAYA